MIDKKNISRNKIIKELYFEGHLSCVSLSEKIDKSFPITSQLIEDLIAKNLVIESGFAQSKGGRRPHTYSLLVNSMFIVSVAMDQFVTKIVIMDMQNNFVSPIEIIALPLHENSKALEVLQNKIEQVVVASGIPKDKFVGIGIGMPGFVDVKKGVNYSFLQLPNDKSITKVIADKLGIPVFIDNDSSLIALAEFRFGAAKGEQNAMVINIGWGVGLGLIIGGELYHGHEGFAGEFSHIPLFLNGKLCSCGKIGCLETETSLLFIIEKAKEGIGKGRLSKLGSLSLEDPELASDAIIKAAKSGDQFATEIFSQAGYNIGKGIAVLIHLLNPNLIILSGRGSSAGKVWNAAIQLALNEHCIERLYKNTRIAVSTIGLSTEQIGAAALVMENFGGATTIRQSS